MNRAGKPIVVITGAAGNIGRSLADALSDAYTVVGLDREGMKADFPLIPIDLTDNASVAHAMKQLANDHGTQIASHSSSASAR